MGYVDDSWKVPLREKAEIFERNVLYRHWINGLYPSTVDFPPGYEGPLDPTTEGRADVAHSINWTSYYLGGQCYRYLFTKDEKVKEHCNKIFRAICRCMEVTGVKGLLARGYVFGHGPSYEEREGSPKSNYWRQGAPPYENLNARPIAIAAGHRVRYLFVAAKEGFFKTTAAGTSEGIYRSLDYGEKWIGDGGRSWRRSNEGLEIPLAYRAHAPIGSDEIYCSTPAGLFVSSDKGLSWESANLVLIFHQNMQRGIGGADLLDAYWRARRTRRRPKAGT